MVRLVLIHQKRLTYGENLLIARLRAGLTQVEAAKEQQLPLATYQAAEKSKMSTVGTKGVPQWELEDLELSERCLIYRRRAGLTQAQVAARMKRCRHWVNQMERGRKPTAELEEFWSNYGND